jgi:predicted alpha/beta superfamily hydrolase
MKRIVPCLVALVLLAGIAAAGVPIVIGETITIQSKILGEGRTILVSTPPDYDTSQGAFPVLYMTDGDAHLSHTRGTVDFLVRNALMPSMIIGTHRKGVESSFSF